MAPEVKTPSLWGMSLALVLNIEQNQFLLLANEMVCLLVILVTFYMKQLTVKRCIITFSRDMEGIDEALNNCSQHFYLNSFLFLFKAVLV